MHHLSAMYAQLIFNNWCYYLSSSKSGSTKVKKPYIEHLVFRGVQASLLPILSAVGVFPELDPTCEKIFPQLELFHNLYENKSDLGSYNTIKSFEQWITRELIKRQPTHETSIPSQLQLLPRDTTYFVRAALFQDGLATKSLMLPHMLGCMVRFMQTHSFRTPPRGKLFEAGWLVDNNTHPTKTWQRNNPSFAPKSPRHMPCLQEEYDQEESKEWLGYLSMAVYEDLNDMPVSMLQLSLLCFKCPTPMHDSMLEGMTRASSYIANQGDNLQTLIHFVTEGVKLSPSKKKPKSTPKKKKAKADKSESPDIDEERVISPPSAKRKKSSTATKSVTLVLTPKDLEWINFVNDSTKWDDADLTPPPVEMPENNNTKCSEFYHDILEFDKKRDFAQWYNSMAVELKASIKDSIKNLTGEELQCIANTIQQAQWTTDKKTQEQYKKALLDEAAAKTRELNEKKKKEEAQKKLMRDQELKKEKETARLLLLENQQKAKKLEDAKNEKQRLEGEKLAKVKTIMDYHERLESSSHLSLLDQIGLVKHPSTLEKKFKAQSDLLFKQLVIKHRKLQEVQADMKAKMENEEDVRTAFNELNELILGLRLMITTNANQFGVSKEAIEAHDQSFEDEGKRKRSLSKDKSPANKKAKDNSAQSLTVGAAEENSPKRKSGRINKRGK